MKELPKSRPGQGHQTPTPQPAKDPNRVASPTSAPGRGFVPEASFVDMPLEPPVQRAEQEAIAPREPTNATGIPTPLLRTMEGVLGHDLSNVRLHPNSPKAPAVGARAYAQGTDVHIAPGQFSPNTSEGKRLIGHELTHVVQQSQGRVKSTGDLGGIAINSDPGLEREADRMGARATDGNVSKQSESQAETGSVDSVVQRVIVADGDRYGSADEERFCENYDSDGVRRALRNADFQIRDNSIRAALGDDREYILTGQMEWVEGEKGQDVQKMFYSIFTKQGFVTFTPPEEGDGGKAKSSREVNQYPEYVERPESGLEEIWVGGMITCIAVIIEVLDQEGKVTGAAGGHFVTPEMFAYYGLLGPGYAFISAIKGLVDSKEGQKRFSLFYNNEADRYTFEAMDMIGHEFTVSGYSEGYREMNGPTVHYNFDDEGEAMFS